MPLRLEDDRPLLLARHSYGGRLDPKESAKIITSLLRTHDSLRPQDQSLIYSLAQRMLHSLGQFVRFCRLVRHNVMRWHCALPTGFPHCTSEDDIHEGYFTPKDSLIFPNIWQMLNDPSAYPDLSKFDPERFLVFGGNKIQRDPYEMCFGFGRRICPGKVLLDSTLFIMCATVLAVVDISKAVENGVVIDPPHVQASGLPSKQLPFKCTIEPRSAKAAALVDGEIRIRFW